MSKEECFLYSTYSLLEHVRATCSLIRFLYLSVVYDVLLVFFYCFIVCMCVLMCNFVSYFVCVILCIFVFLCDILLPSGVINDDNTLAGRSTCLTFGRNKKLSCRRKAA